MDSSNALDLACHLCPKVKIEELSVFKLVGAQDKIAAYPESAAP
jgi:hypothetical protein